MKITRQSFLAGLSATAATGWSRLFAESRPFAFRGLADREADIWASLTNRFFDARTEMLYDVMWKLPDGGESLTAFLPTADEIARQYPNPCAWGVGLQDCVFNGSPLLRAALLAGDRKMAYAAYRGMKRCAEVSGVPGFIARGVSPSDGKGFYLNSSRDTFSLFVSGMLAFYRHPFADAQTRAEIAKMLVDVARYAEACVVPKNDYSLLRADGKASIVCRMWVPDPNEAPKVDATGWARVGGMMPHESLRLPMFYAAAHAVSGDARWRELELRYADDGIRIAEKPIGSNIRGSELGQLQLSVRLLWECETDAGRKARYARLLDRCADMAENLVLPRVVRKAAKEGWWRSSPLNDWRPYVRPDHPRRRVVGGLPYEVVDHPAPTIEEPYVELAHAVIVQSLAPGRKISSAMADRFVEVVSQVDFRKVVTANQVNALLASYVLRGVRDASGRGR